MLVTSSVSKVMSDVDVSYGETAEVSAVDPRTSEDVKSMVENYFADIPVMVNVAKCESQFRHTLADGSVLRGRVDSRDTGVMQINVGFHGATAKKLGLDLEDFSDNMVFARYLYEKEGTKPWNASKACWNNSIAMK